MLYLGVSVGGGASGALVPPLEAIVDEENEGLGCIWLNFYFFLNSIFPVKPHFLFLLLTFLLIPAFLFLKSQPTRASAVKIAAACII